MLSARRFVFLMVPVLALAACGEAPKPVPKPKPPVSDTAAAGHYVRDITLAQLALAPPAGSVTAALSYLKAIDTYALEKKKSAKPLPLIILTLEYKAMNAKEKQTLLVPLPLSAEPPEFEELETVLKQLSGVSHTLQDIRTYTVVFTRPPSSKLSKNDPVLLRQQLASRQRHVMTGAKNLPAFENARLQLKLVYVFITYQMRDAAYLALENAKNALAQATAELPGQPDITALSQEAEMLENVLHKEMPYAL